MYFFNSIVVITLVVLGSFSIYRYLNNKKIPINKLKVLYIYLLELIFVLISHNLILYLFIDLSLFVSYILNKRKESILLLSINTIYYYLILNIPLVVAITYILVITIIIFMNKDKYSHLLFIKVFINCFLYFYYIDYSYKSVFLLITIFIYFNILLKVIIDFLNNDIEENDSIIFKVAHEVKNPLAVCKGYLDMLDINDQDKINRYIPIIKKEMNRSLSIMDNFLDTKRINIKRELMDFSLLIEDVKETMKIILKEKNILLDIPELDDEIIIKGDYDKLKQVLINLIKNSYEANAKNIQLKISNINNYIDIKIIDDGIGISKSDLKKLGTIFYTTKATGNGLGISASNEIIKLHNGTLTFDSKLNNGTCVTLELPLEYIFKEKMA